MPVNPSPNFKVLHLCNDFSKQTLYKSLFEELSTLGVNQDVYVSIRDLSELNKNSSQQHFNTFYDFILKPYDKVFFNNKIKKIFNSISQKTNFIETAQIVHAHFFYSDGAVALKIKNNFNIDYIVAIRNTDINYFMRLRPDLRQYGISIALESKALVFLNSGYRKRFISAMPEHIQLTLSAKSHVIPNGLSDAWFPAIDNFSSQLEENIIKVLYVGDFSRNKNVKKLIRGIGYLNDQSIKTSLTIVGGGLDDSGNVRKEIERFGYCCDFIGRIENLEDLKKIYQSHHILAIPSKYETFGMVFIEALSQGCQLIFTNGEAISGLIKEKNIAIGLDAHSPKDIANAITELFKNRPTSRMLIANFADDFRLSRLAKKYQALYQQFII